MKAFKVLNFALIFYFLIPYVIFISFFHWQFSIDLNEFFWAFKNSLIQSLSAACAILFLAVPASCGLFRLHPRWQALTKKLLLIPQVLPSFFTILIAFSIWNPFPLGNIGITFLFILIHLGFAVVLIQSAMVEKLGPFPYVAKVFSLSRFEFFLKIYFPLLRADLISCFLLIFVFCFSSFAIPLIAGGGRDTNLEVLIYEKIFISQNWSAAWVVSLVQSLFLTLVSLFLLRRDESSKREFIRSEFLSSNVGLIIVFGYLLIFNVGYGLGVVRALPELSKLDSFYSDILQATLNSLSLLLVYVALSCVLLFAWLLDYVRHQKLNFAGHFIAASTMLVGFSFYLFFPQNVRWDFFKLPFAMSILVFPVLFKSFLEKSILDLKEQVVTAKIFGISNLQIVLHIIFRQIQRNLGVWFLFLSIWFICDFAVSRALGTQIATLGLLSQSFLSSYRISLSYLMSLYILVVWSLVLLTAYFLKGVASVAYQKFSLKL